jgi:hypothetical protein
MPLTERSETGRANKKYQRNFDLSKELRLCYRQID